MINRESFLAGVLFYSTWYFFRAGFRERSIHVPANFALRLVAFRYFMATRGIFGNADRCVIGAQRSVDQKESFRGCGQEATVAFYRALNRGFIFIPLLRCVFIRLQGIGLQVFDGSLARDYVCSFAVCGLRFRKCPRFWKYGFAGAFI